ncbi:hypothetical protein JCGZ_17456 [Jatropha curcas]|uniref:Uncharacterized protein n=1 Tax=Jatropha curcas TaxID=180498 RepID=A0A067LL92_JATCU|nr:hypothetical protein JCGZ_17456 [Jatropha curcas]
MPPRITREILECMSADRGKRLASQMGQNPVGGMENPPYPGRRTKVVAIALPLLSLVPELPPAASPTTFEFATPPSTQKTIELNGGASISTSRRSIILRFLRKVSSYGLSHDRNMGKCLCQQW